MTTQIHSPLLTSLGNSLKSNLVVTTSATTTLTITADTLEVKGVVLTAVSLSANIASSGANGLDTGSPSSSTWYAIHVITNANGSSVAALLSLSATAPTLPGGYTLFRRVGWVRRNASNLFVESKRIDSRVYLADPTAFTQTFSGTQTTNGLLSFATSIPTTATVGFFTGGVGVNKTSTPTATAGSSSIGLRYSSSYSYWYPCSAAAYNASSGSLGVCASAWEYPVTSQQIDTSISIVTQETASASLSPVGYIDLV